MVIRSVLVVLLVLEFPLVVPKALANRAEELHKNGEKFQISVLQVLRLMLI